MGWSLNHDKWTKSSLTEALAQFAILSFLTVSQRAGMSFTSTGSWCFSPYNATFFSPLFLGAYDGQDTPGDCAVGARPQRRGSLQSYTPGGATQLGITGGAAPPSALVLFSPKRPCKCQRKKWASIVSNIW